MILLEKTEVVGIDHAIRGMRNPMNSWDRMDTTEFELGDNDLNLMRRLAKGGPVHAKYRRMMVVYVDIAAPLYWWKEFDTYKVGTVANSCSTMHKLTHKPFELSDFSTDHLRDGSIGLLTITVEVLNKLRDAYLETKDKAYWYEIIQLLPSSYNQRRTIMLNYEVLVGMYRDRKHHKLDEWVEFCKWIKALPLSELILSHGIHTL